MENKKIIKASIYDIKRRNLRSGDIGWRITLEVDHAFIEEIKELITADWNDLVELTTNDKSK